MGNIHVGDAMERLNNPTPEGRPDKPTTGIRSDALPSMACDGRSHGLSNHMLRLLACDRKFLSKLELKRKNLATNVCAHDLLDLPTREGAPT